MTTVIEATNLLLKMNEGAGFNTFDRTFVQSIMTKVNNGFCTARMEQSLKMTLYRYIGQLQNFGLVWKELELVQTSSTNKTLPVTVEKNPTPVQSNSDMTWFEDRNWSEWREIFFQDKNTGQPVKKRVKSVIVGDDQNFARIWASKRQELFRLGYSVKEFNGEKVLSKWEDIIEKTVDRNGIKIIKTINNLLTYQVDHVKDLIVSYQVYNSFFDGSDTGTGKTYTALAVCKELGLTPLIICPKSVMRDWVHIAMKKFDMRIIGIANWELIKGGKMYRPQYCNGLDNKAAMKLVKVDCAYIKKTDKKAFTYSLIKGQCVIMDEVHRAKHHDTQNAELVIGTKDSNVTRFLLSATVATTPLELFAVGYAIGLFQTKQLFWNWCKAHGCTKKSNDFVSSLEYTGGRKMMETINRELFPKHGNRMRIEEIRKKFPQSFPETKILTNPVSLKDEDTKAINDTYIQMSQEIAMLSAEEKHTEGMVKTLRARQKIELLKIPMIVEMVHDLIDSGSSVAIFVNFRSSVENLCTELETQCRIWGGQSEQERSANIEAFQSNQSRIIICNIASGGVGVSLHDLSGNYPRYAIISPSYSAQELKQALGRVHRAGGHTSIQRILYVAGTVEEEIAEILDAKIGNMAALNDGDLDGGLFK